MTLAAFSRQALRSSSNCNAAVRRVVASSAVGKATPAASTLTRLQPFRSYTVEKDGTSQIPHDILTPQEREFFNMGYIDEMGLTSFNSLHELQARSCKVFASHRLFGTYDANSKQFEWMNYEQFDEKVAHTRSVLKELDVGAYDKIGIISNNRWEWAAIATAGYSLNANIVPMYEAQLSTDWTYILNDSGAKVVFTANDTIYQRVQAEVKGSVPTLKHVVSLDGAAGEPHSFATLFANTTADLEGKLITSPPSGDDLANLIYTSGTTGKPKGVELTHLNFTSNIKSAVRTMVEKPRDFLRFDDCSLAFLPWAHSYGQTCELWSSMAHGASMGVSRGVMHILDDLQLVKPTILFAVPTLYKKIYDGVHNLIETSSPVRKRLMKKALALGWEDCEASLGRRPPLGFFERVQFKALDSIVLSKIRARFGGRMRHGFVAGAACPSEVLDFMDSVGITVCEGYGLTETSPIICINTPEQRHVGSVGRPIGGVTVHIIGEDGKPVPDGEEGEICCVGPNVMRGYYKNKEATDEVISIAPDGKSRMFHTGDLGRIVPGKGFVKVTGRLKEQYKLENGKYIVPTPIEEAVSMSRFISQVVLYGSNRPYNVALLVPDWSAIRTELKLPPTKTEEELANDAAVKKLIDEEIRMATARLKKYEVPQGWALVAPFTAANNMLTPKMSIRRHKVVETYMDIIESLYESNKSSHIKKDTETAKKDTDEAAAA